MSLLQVLLLPVTQTDATDIHWSLSAKLWCVEQTWHQISKQHMLAVQTNSFRIT